MKLSLHELREQKALLEKHLAWLDARIRELEKEGSGASTPHPMVPAGAELPRESSSLFPETPDPAILEQQESDPTGSARHTKLGCILLVIAACLLVLFCLFGLPYLLYSSP